MQNKFVQKEIKKTINKALFDNDLIHEYYKCTEQGFKGLDKVLMEDQETYLHSLHLPKFMISYYKRTLLKSKLYDNLCSNYFKKGDIVLDGGCGKRSIIRKWWQPEVKVIGIDILLSSLKVNNDLDNKLAANLDHIPFIDNYFDVIRLNGVSEHLENPQFTYRECYRVLKKGGYLLLKTQSVYNPFYLLNGILSTHIRFKIIRNILKIEGQVYPAYYKSNSKRSISKILII